MLFSLLTVHVNWLLMVLKVWCRWQIFIKEQRLNLLFLENSVILQQVLAKNIMWADGPAFKLTDLLTNKEFWLTSSSRIVMSSFEKRELVLFFFRQGTKWQIHITTYPMALQYILIWEDMMSILLQLPSKNITPVFEQLGNFPLHLTSCSDCANCELSCWLSWWRSLLLTSATPLSPQSTIRFP